MGLGRAGAGRSAPGADEVTALSRFAWNCVTAAEVDAAFAKAIGAGASLLRKPEKTDYGGYRGYFSDPDGHTWEVVQAPGFAFTKDGRLILPE